MAVFEGISGVDMRKLIFFAPGGPPVGPPQTTLEQPIYDTMIEGTDTYGGTFQTVQGPGGVTSTGRVTSFSTDRVETWEDNEIEWTLVPVKYQMSGFDVDIAVFRTLNGLNLLRAIFGGDDQLSGSGTLLGFNGNDTLTGSIGSDVLDGGLGADTMIGGGGSDVFYVDNVGDVVIGGSQLGGQVKSSISYTLPSNIYALALSGSLVINGVGNDQNNSLMGSDGANNLYGRLGDDILIGRGGHDVLSGGYGNDTLTGGEGADRLLGGAGADTFVFQWAEHSNLANRDRINDFNQAEGDKIDVKGVDAREAARSDQAFTFIGTQSFHEKAGELRYLIKNGNTYIHGDTNGDGAIDFTIRLDTAVNLTASDFIL